MRDLWWQRWQQVAAAAAALLLGACASIPKGEYGVDALEIEGAQQLSPQAVKRCLFTLERARATLILGVAQQDCDQGPFDTSPPELSLWRWPWTEWPTLNVAVMEADRRRIERFYRARGFYDARVIEIRYDPEAAADPSQQLAAGQCNPETEACTVRISVLVQEGKPLHVGQVRVEGLDTLPAATRAIALNQAALPKQGERFDETDYDRGKTDLATRLAEAAFADARVTGEVRLDHVHKLANITYRAKPGPSYRFGPVRVDGPASVPRGPIIANAGIKHGSPYRQSALAEVQRDVYELGAFTSVEVSRELDSEHGLVVLHIKVVPLDRDAFRLGLGVTSGSQARNAQGAWESIPQWDIHLFARYERRHLLSTLGKLRIEERPRVIFDSPFPQADRPSLGNILALRFTEPGLIEARTLLSVDASWDLGPDAYLGFRRSDLALRLAAQRPFFWRTLFATLALEYDRYLVADGAQTSDGSPVPSSYTYSYFEQEVHADLRDDELQPRKGAYIGLTSSQSVKGVLSDWTLLRLIPDVRVYIPLPLHMVLAARLTVGARFIVDAAPELDPTGQALGPNSYRLRGGGAQGNRGFVAGELGVGREGGTRSWESSLELRTRLGSSLGAVLFYDMGNVTQDGTLHFGQPNPSLGFGMRYYTLVGALRVDLGFRLGEAARASSSPLLFGQPGAFHVTLGEAF